MSLVLPSCLGFIPLPACWLWSAQSLFLSACEDLKPGFSLSFFEERLPCSGSSLDRAKKKNSQPTRFRFKGGYQCWAWSWLTACLSLSLFSTVLQKAAMEVVDFSVDFCGGFLCREMQKKNTIKTSARKSATRKLTIRQNTTPQNHQPDQKICRKIYQQIQASNLLGAHVRRRLQSMDSGTLLAILWAGVGCCDFTALSCERRFPSLTSGWQQLTISDCNSPDH